MFNKLKEIISKVKDLNTSVDSYKNESIIQSLPSVAIVNRCKKLIMENKFDEAEKILLSALDNAKEDFLVYKYLGRIYEIKKQFPKACEYYEKTSILNPDDKDIWLRYGMALLYSGKFNDALSSFEKADKLTPLNTDVYTGWGMAYMRLKKYAAAEEKFNIAAQISKYNFSAILLSAVMEVRQEKFAIAEEKLKFLVKTAPNEASLYEYANLKLIKEDYKEAEKYALKTIEINRQMLPAYLVLGEIYSIQKNIAAVEKIFTDAKNSGLDDSILYFEWGKANIRLFEFQKAREQFNTAIEKKPEFNDAKIGIALLNSYENNFELLDELKERNMNNVYIMEGVGLELLSENNILEAIETFKKAIKIDPKQTYIYYDLIQAYKKLNEPVKIREFYEKFIEVNPHYTKALEEYSQWLVETGNYEEAKRKLRKLLSKDENNIKALNLLFFVQYTLVINNISEYNIREALSTAQKIKSLGNFEHGEKEKELENILNSRK